MKMSWSKYLFFALLTACQSVQENAGQFLGDFEIEPQFTLNKEASDFVATHCVVYDLKSNKQHFSRGNPCAFPENEIIRYKKGKLTAEDAKGNVLWSRPYLHLHHVLRVSRDKDEILAIDKQYWRDKKDKCYSTDLLLVLNRQGEVVKSFSFEKFTRSFAMSQGKPDLHARADDSCKTANSPVTDKTHVRHFEEFREQKKPQGKGYMALDIKNSKLYLFDESLQVVKIHSNRDHVMQAPVQVGYNLILYYELKKSAAGESATVQLTKYDIDDRSYRTVYTSPVAVGSQSDCGSIFPLNANQIFIGHGACVTHQPPDVFYTELVDLKLRISKLSKVKHLFSPSVIEPFFPDESFLRRKNVAPAVD